MNKILTLLILGILFMHCSSSKKVSDSYNISAEEAEERALKVGDVAPNFTLHNPLGEEVKLSELLQDGPVVITWYRGNWCPHCNIALHDLQEYLPQIQAQNATLVAISPELPDNSLTTQQKHDLEFEVLSDVGNNVAKKYNIVFQLDDAKAKLYQVGVGLHKHNGDKSNQLPLPATFIVNTEGKIIWAFVDADYKLRANPEDIVNALQNL